MKGVMHSYVEAIFIWTNFCHESFCLCRGVVRWLFHQHRSIWEMLEKSDCIHISSLIWNCWIIENDIFILGEGLFNLINRLKGWCWELRILPDKVHWITRESRHASNNLSASSLSTWINKCVTIDSSSCPKSNPVGFALFLSKNNILNMCTLLWNLIESSSCNASLNVWMKIFDLRISDLIHIYGSRNFQKFLVTWLRHQYVNIELRLTSNNSSLNTNITLTSTSRCKIDRFFLFSKKVINHNSL